MQWFMESCRRGGVDRYRTTSYSRLSIWTALMTTLMPSTQRLPRKRFSGFNATDQRACVCSHTRITDQAVIPTQFVVVVAIARPKISWEILRYVDSLRNQPFPITLVKLFDISTGVQPIASTLNDIAITVPIGRYASIDFIFVEGGS